MRACRALGALWLCGLIFGVVTGGANAALLQVTPGGILTGATGVNVDGVLYNVTFQDGTCTALYDGCDSSSDFAFATQAAADRAAQALLDQVFIDISGTGAFDQNPTLTRGCSLSLRCQVLTAWGTLGGLVLAAIANNGGGADVDSVISAVTVPAFIDTANDGQATYAVWTAATATVPSPPPGLLMMSAALSWFSVAALRKRHRGS